MYRRTTADHWLDVPYFSAHMQKQAFDEYQVTDWVGAPEPNNEGHHVGIVRSSAFRHLRHAETGIHSGPVDTAIRSSILVLSHIFILCKLLPCALCGNAGWG